MRASAERDWQAPTAPEPWTDGGGHAASREGAGRARRAAPRARPARRGGTRAGDLARGLTGSLVAGLAVLAVVLIGVQVWSDANGKVGPGVGLVVGHVIVAGVALVLQAVADRRRDTSGGLSALGALVAVLGALTYWWL